MEKLSDKQKGIIFLTVIFAIIAGAVIYFVHSLKTDTVRDILEQDKLLRMLLVVEDDENKELFSTVLLYDPETKKAASISIPTNVGAIWEPLGRTDGIESVYNEKGMVVYKQEVSKLLGIQIPFTVTIKLQDFVRLSDMLGGMRVFIPSPIDYFSEAENKRYLLPSGAVNLDGDKVAVYMTYRVEEESEENILDRYQNVVVAFLTGIHDKSFIMFKNDNYKRFLSCINSNLSEIDERSLFKILSEIDAESIIRQTVTGSPRTVEDKKLLFPYENGERIKSSVKSTTSMIVATDGTISSHQYVLEIQNGTTKQGIASRTAKKYKDSSYDVLASVNADRNDYEKTVIIDHIGNETAAKNVGELIHCTNIIQADASNTESTKKAVVDFTIILGADYNGDYVINKN